MPLHPPILSLPDPLQESEGSVDPLSLQRTYERLADKILPAVTVRMGRIRFVTAMCLGALVCSDFGDSVASDGVTPPWLVFEWFVIEAFVRTEDSMRGEGIPGFLKVQSCLRTRNQVSAASDLKTPTVFGFSGIFKRLASESHILHEDMTLDDGGWDVLKAWERERGLRGLIQGSGPGADLVYELRDAVHKGMAAGHTVPRRSELWTSLAEHLHPGGIGAQEGRVLLHRLRSSSELTCEHLDLLRQHANRVERPGEADYFRTLRGKCSEQLAAYLHAIDAYEALCRPIVEAFDVIRELSTNRATGPVAPESFASSPAAGRLVKEVAEGCARIQGDPHLLDWEPDVRLLLDHFDQVRGPAELFEAVIDHHEDAQARKPPDGKRPWLERAQSNSVMVRSLYALPQRAEDPPPYVHDYRTVTLCRFLSDGGELS